jgi:uncharacterized RDD family membrane protein YckC
MAIDVAVLVQIMGIFLISGLWEIALIRGRVVLFAEESFPIEMAILPFFWAFFCLPLIYFLLLHWVEGQTVGKMLLRIQVIGEDGMSLTFGKAFFRFLGYFLSAIPLGVGFLWAAIDEGGQGWHDKFSQTRVVRLV